MNGRIGNGLDWIGSSRTSSQYHNRSFDLVSVDGNHPSSNPSSNPKAFPSVKAVYTYSSSDDSLDASYCSSEMARGLVTALANINDAEETVETLCEWPTKLHSSTPSLSAHSLVAAHPSWASVGSSSSAPRPTVRPKRRPVAAAVYRQRRAVESAAWSSTDDADPLVDNLTSLAAQTGAFKSTLTQLEADLSASRRDMGWLQENLATVQNAAAGVSDKVVKMQSQVINMERQITNAVKVMHRWRIGQRHVVGTTTPLAA